ncbi:MAG: metal ABC transporter ATP-binding protein [Deltaproteobacteria bacterium]|uniref:Zinc ABC transporter ATP-binding protein n=1 Tax=Desulforhabdus amnigena TaxID=40218 RepID=A0A9W6FV37_9BACT|nr:metal ABC transporter ATP-binding protein [Deltaproteobacteria bacterium]GLI35422.1 zinc ABC transporter ATP-binding protein [Desulforhabdus amnigena]
MEVKLNPLAIEIEDVFFSYDGHLVLRDVNLKIEHGEFLAILGPNGSGKTTLLKLMLGILKPQRGTVRIFGKEPHKVVDRIGYVPQDTNINKDFPITVQDVALMGRLGQTGRSRRYSHEDILIVQQALERVKMWEYRGRPIGKLSGGQRQRVFIARALAANPSILFMDEPTSNVDKALQTELYEFLKELNRSMTIVVVSHDLSVLSSYIKSVACLNQTLYFHAAAEITQEMMDMAYHCPVELIAHGFPHRVLGEHKDK